MSLAPTVSSICENYLASGSLLDDGTASLVSSLLLSHNLLSRDQIPTGWANALVSRVRAIASAPVAVASVAATLKLMRLTLRKCSTPHVSAHASSYITGLVAAWKQHESCAVRALVANSLDCLLQRTYSCCSSEFPKKLRTELPQADTDTERRWHRSCTMLLRVLKRLVAELAMRR